MLGRLRDELAAAGVDTGGWTFDHIGSTAVPDLLAKRFVDLQVGVIALPGAGSAVERAFARCGFVPALGARPDSPGVHCDWIRDPDLAPHDAYDKRLFFRPDAEPPKILHVRLVNAPWWSYTVLFRDWLRANEPGRRAYEAVKLAAAAAHALDADYDDYTRDKSVFFDQVHESFEAFGAQSPYRVRRTPGPRLEGSPTSIAAPAVRETPGEERSADPVGTARQIIAERFPTARAAWLGGSVVRGDATATSDLDITVLIPGPPAPFRDSIRYAGWPVELFVHDRGSLTMYRQKDRDRRQPTIMRLVGESIILVDRDRSGVELQRECAGEIESGPAPLTPDELASARYGVTDLLTDLEGAHDDAERAAISAALWQASAGLLLTASGHWTGTGKGLVRALRRYDLAESATYATDLMNGLRRSTNGHPTQLIKVCDAILDRFGGRRFEGHRLGGETPTT